MPNRLVSFAATDDIRCSADGACWKVLHESMGNAQVVPVAVSDLTAAQQARRAALTAQSRQHHAAQSRIAPSTSVPAAGNGHHGVTTLPTSQLTPLGQKPPTSTGKPAGRALPYASAKGMTVTYHHADGSIETRHGTHPYRDNNPGDLIGGYGSLGKDRGGGHPMAMYDTLEIGRAALKSLLQGTYADLSILDTMKVYCPEFDNHHHRIPGNNPVKYANDLADAIHLPVSTLIKSLTPDDLDKFMDSIAHQEGFYAPGQSKITPPPAKPAPKP